MCETSLLVVDILVSRHRWRFVFWQLVSESDINKQDQDQELYLGQDLYLDQELYLDLDGRLDPDRN